MCLASLEKTVSVLALTPAFLEPNPFRALIGSSGSLADHVPKQQGQPHSAEELSVSITPWGFVWRQEDSLSKCLGFLEVDSKTCSFVHQSADIYRVLSACQALCSGWGCIHEQNRCGPYPHRV